MISKHAPGYSGHKPAGEILPPSLKPGDSVPSLATKFTSMAKPYPNNNEPTKLNFVPSTLESFNITKASDYHVPDKRGISLRFLETAPRSKDFVGKSQFSEEVRNNKKEAASFQEIPLEELQSAFDSLADNEGLIDTRKIKLVLSRGFNVPYAPRWIVDKFTAYFAKFGSRPDGLCDWSEFTRAHRAVIASCASEASIRPQGFPQWVLDSRKAPIKSVTAMDGKSSYQYDLGEAGQKPLERDYTYKATMNSTSLDLMAGTPKTTYNPPGYGGHIPESLRHAHTRLHAEKDIPRPPRNDQLLTYHNNMPGYSGFFPSYSLETVKPRDFGGCAKTTMGASVLGLML